MNTAEEIIKRMKDHRELIESESAMERARRRGFPYRDPWYEHINCNPDDCEKIEKLIRQQQQVIDDLNDYTDFTQPFPEHTEWANAAGGRSEGYEQSPDAIKKATDWMEDFVNTIGPAIELGLTIIWEQGPTPKVRKLKRDIEIQRSKQFIEVLKAACWWCCGQAAFDGMVRRLASPAGPAPAPNPNAPH